MLVFVVVLLAMDFFAKSGNWLFSVGLYFSRKKKIFLDAI